MTNTANITTEFTTEDDVTVAIGDRISIEGDVSTVTKIAGRWVTLSNGSNVSRAVAADARAEYLDDEETLGDEIESGDDESGDDESGDDESGDDESGDDESRDIVDPEYRLIYVKGVSANGNRTFDSNDELATALRGKTLGEILHICCLLLPNMYQRWAHLNAGQQSMNARNAIRQALRKGVITMDYVATAVDAAARTK